MSKETCAMLASPALVSKNDDDEGGGGGKGGEAEESEHLPLAHGCSDAWGWSGEHKSSDVLLCARSALFHPNWSYGTAAVRGTRPLGRSLHYWEIKVSDRLFGTAIMFGVCTAQARLHAKGFVPLVGEDEHGWALSHKGLAWHGGRGLPFTEPFQENRPTTIGLLFDGRRGTLGFYHDGRWLGQAFRGLQLVQEPLFPVVASTAAKTELTLGVTRRSWDSLKDRARHVLLGALRHPDHLRALPLPHALRDYLADALPPEDAHPLGYHAHTSAAYDVASRPS
ncbi:SPRY domain-containing SOCS box protein SP555 [Oratosquilla oratoria]|uniref:SPRY domain-containing SOCS box protein SP555 n=1 Tax=Oratosquilla oratoria TaxID=337810 RepID=UPI003F76D5FF